MKSRRVSTLALGATVLMLARGWEMLAPDTASLYRFDPLRISTAVVAADFGGSPPPLPQGHGHKMFDKGGPPPPPPPPPPGGKGGGGKDGKDGDGKGGKDDKHHDKHHDKHKPPPKPKPPKPEPPPPTTTTTTTVTTTTTTTST